MTLHLLVFCRNCWLLAKQTGPFAGDSDYSGLSRWIHVIVHCLRPDENWTYTEIFYRLGLITELCELLDLLPETLPDPSTFYYSFNRFEM